MSDGFWQPAVALVAPFVLGSALLGALGLRFASDRVAYAGWVWLAGALGIAGVEFLWLLFGLGTSSALGRELVVLLAAAGLFWHARGAEPVPGEAPRGTPRERAVFHLLFALSLALVLNKLLLGTLEPIYTDDEAQFWSMRAKLLFAAGGFGPEYQAGLRTLNHGDYPLLNPLLQVWMFVHAGEVTHCVNRLPLQLATPAVVCILAGAVRRHLRPSAAGLLVVAFLGTPLILTAVLRAHSDILVALGGLVVLDAWLRWRDDPRDAWIVLGALGAGTLAWAKNEGFLVLLALVLVALLAHLRKRRPFSARLAHLAWLAPFAAVFVTVLHNRLFELESDVLHGRDGHGLLARFLERWSVTTGEVLAFFGELARDGEALQLLPVALLVLLLLDRAGARRLAPALFVQALVALGLLVVLIATPASVDWHLRTAGKRLALQLYPAVTLCVAVLMGRWLPAKR
jgi:hypothetical protein